MVDKEVLLNVERQKKRLEEDKQAAVKELEKRSEELAKEKEEKQRLEAKIQAMTSQVLVGGQPIEETVQF